MSRGEHKENAAWIREAIRAGQAFHARTKAPARHNLINLGALAVLLLGLVLVAALGAHAPKPLYVPLAGVAFGLLYFGLFILVIHEASHGMFLRSADPARQKSLNRAFGWAVSLLFATHFTRQWEQGHHEHHVRPLEPADPQKHNGHVGKALLARVLGCALIPGYFLLDRTIFRKRDPREGRSGSGLVIAVFFALWAGILTALALTLGGHVALAAYLGVQNLAALNHLKGSLEHGGALKDEPDPYLRSRSTFFPGRALLMPFHISVHFEHHLNYRVPWYDLMRYHRALRGIVPKELHARVWNHRPFSQLRGEALPSPGASPAGAPQGELSRPAA